MINAGKKLINLGDQNVLIKGGHRKAYYAEDIFISKKEFKVLKNKKIPFVYLNKNNLNLCPIKEMENINYITSDLSVKRLIKNKYKKNFNFEKFSKIYV